MVLQSPVKDHAYETQEAGLATAGGAHEGAAAILRV